MNARIPAIRQYARPRLAVASTSLAVAAAIACMSAAGQARAATRYIVDEPINRILERTSDDHGLCRRHGMSMNPLVLFQATRTRGDSAHWHGPTERFVQYPGTSACVVWKRRGQ
jgi:hypothetical protein